MRVWFYRSLRRSFDDVTLGLRIAVDFAPLLFRLHYSARTLPFEGGSRWLFFAVLSNLEKLLRLAPKNVAVRLPLRQQRL